MGKYANDAQNHFDKIRHYYQNAGAAGYSQAKYHYGKIQELIHKSYGSVKNQNDIPIIQAIVKDAKPLMDEMKQLESDLKKKTDSKSSNNR